VNYSLYFCSVHNEGLRYERMEDYYNFGPGLFRHVQRQYEMEIGEMSAQRKES